MLIVRTFCPGTRPSWPHRTSTRSRCWGATPRGRRSRPGSRSGRRCTLAGRSARRSRCCSAQHPAPGQGS